MVPESILKYLNREHVAFARIWHPRAITGQEVAATLHISGDRVSKCVVVNADGDRMLAVLPVSARVDTEALARGLGCNSVQPLSEDELAGMFPDCELGAEPPFGRLYGLPVVVDAQYAERKMILFRGGSHEETLEMRYRDFEVMESPRVARFALRMGVQPAAPSEQPHA